MTNPSNKKRVVTDDDIQVLDAHIAYAKTQADRAAGVVDEFDRATGEFAGVLQEIEQTQADTEEAVEKLNGWTFKRLDPPPYVGSVQVSVALTDSAENVVMYFTTAGQAVFPAGFSEIAAQLATLAGLNFTAASPTTTGGYATIPLQGNGGGVVHGIDASGRHILPAGVVGSLSTLAGRGLTFDRGGTRLDGELVTSLPDLVAWGDSLTQGSGGNGIGWTELLSASLGRNVMNRGISGQTSSEIAARAGAIAITVPITGGTIAASGDTAIGKPAPHFAYGQIGPLFGWLGGVYGSVTRTGGDITTPVYTFTRTTAGAAIITASAAWVPDNAALREYTTVIWAGRNDVNQGVTDNAIIKANIAAIAGKLTPLRPRFLVVSVTPTTTEPTGNANNTQIRALNTDLAALYGDRFVDLWGTALIRGDGSLDPTYSPDGIHLYTAGYGIVRDQIQARINGKGW